MVRESAVSAGPGPAAGSGGGAMRDAAENLLPGAGRQARGGTHAELSAQDVEDTLREICAHPTFALGRPFKDFGRKVAEAVA